MTRRLFWLFAFLLVPLPAQAQFLAGGATRVITPKDPVWMAGYGQNRKSEGVHDDLYAHCLHLKGEKGELTFITVDLVGFFYDDVRKVRKMLEEKGLDGSRVIVGSTHVHSGPDTMGLWGPMEGKSGIDKSYMDFLFQQMVNCAEEARVTAQPAEMGLARGTIKDVCHNTRKGDQYQQDHEVRLMQWRQTGKDKVIATLVNYGCHPEVMNEKILTADFPSVLYKRLGQATNAPVLYANGILGGMITPMEQGETWEEMTRLGGLFADQVMALLKNLAWSTPKEIIYGSKEMTLPVTNGRFIMAKSLGVFDRRISKRNIFTELSFARVGGADFLTIPGEPLPAFGMRMKFLLPSDYQFVIGLGNDELGYIIDKEVFDLDRYEETVSLGPETAPLLYKAAKDLVQKTLQIKP